MSANLELSTAAYQAPPSTGFSRQECSSGLPLPSLNRGQRTGKGQFSFQFQRRAMWKNVHTTIQLHSFHMLSRLRSKPFKPGFSNMWTKNFQMYKPGFKEAEEPEIKLTTFVGSRRKQGNSRRTFLSASLTRLNPLTLWITRNWKILKEMGMPDHLACLLRNLYAGQKATELDIEQQIGSKLGKEYIKAVVTLLI